VTTVRRIATGLVVGAVAALFVAAGVDALRGGGEPEPTAAEREPESEKQPTPVRAQAPPRTFFDARADLRAAGVPAGLLTYVDEDCRLHSVTLPDLGEHPGPEGRTCALAPAREGKPVFGAALDSPDGTLRVTCRRGALTLRFSDRTPYVRLRHACEVAWRGAGSPTFLRRGAVVEPAACPGKAGILPLRCTQTLLSRGRLVRELRRAGWDGFELEAAELRWLDRSRFALVVTARSGDEESDLLALFEGRRLLAPPRFSYGRLAGIRPSPSGAFLSVRILDPGGLLVLDREGEPVPLAMRHGHALAWSPDERWVAQATEDGVYVFRTGDRSPTLVQIPVEVGDLVWR
jgi:hypothetical protein